MPAASQQRSAPPAPERPAREVSFDELVTGRGRHRDAHEPVAPVSPLRRFALRARLVQTPARRGPSAARPPAGGAAR